MAMVSTGCQTMWTFSPWDVVDNCPTPLLEPFLPTLPNVPKKLHSTLMYRYMRDNDYKQFECNATEESASDMPAPTMSLEQPDQWYSQQGQAAAQPKLQLELGDSLQPTAHSNLHSIANLIKKPRPSYSEEDPRTVVGPPSTSAEDVSSSTSDMDPVETKQNKEPLNTACQVCGDSATVFHCGAFVCEACKKFYNRASKQPCRNGVCTGGRAGNKDGCLINKSNRTACSYCRYKKCQSIGMELPGKGLLDTHSVKSLPCRVCGAPSSGYHFGVLTCEGCKGFFRRQTQSANLKAEPRLCRTNGNCEISALSRSQCRACRLQKCLRVGMSKDASRIGRQPNNVRYARIMENRAIHTRLDDTDIDSREAAISSVNNNLLKMQEDSTSTLSLQAESPMMSSVTNDLSPAGANPQSSIQSPPPLSCGAASLALLEKCEYPMDLSLNYPKPLDLSPKIHTSPPFCIEQLASLFEFSFHTYFKLVKDDDLMDPDVDDAEFISRIYDIQFPDALRLFINHLKKVAGFMQLHLEDRILLTKCSIYRFFLLVTSQKYDLETGNHYIFGWRSWKGATDRLISLYPEYKFLTHHFNVYGKQIKQKYCSANELGLLTVLNVINEDNLEDLKDQQGVTRLYKEYMKLLAINTQANHADPAERMQELTSALDLCRQAAKEHAAAAKNVINKYPSYAASAAHSAAIISQLYKEMFSSTPWEHRAIS